MDYQRFLQRVTDIKPNHRIGLVHITSEAQSEQQQRLRVSQYNKADKGRRRRKRGCPLPILIGPIIAVWAALVRDHSGALPSRQTLQLIQCHRCHLDSSLHSSRRPLTTIKQLVLENKFVNCHKSFFIAYSSRNGTAQETLLCVIV